MKINGKEIKGNDFHPTIEEHYKELINIMNLEKGFKQIFQEICEIQEHFLLVEKFAKYILPKNPYKFEEIIPPKTIQVEDVEYTWLDGSEKWEREIYKEVFRKTAEKYGKESLAYKSITYGIDKESLTGSQLFWITNLTEYLPKGLETISLEDVKKIKDKELKKQIVIEGLQSSKNKFLRYFYVDLEQIILKTKDYYLKRDKFVLEDLVQQVEKRDQEFSIYNPLIVSNLKLIKDENPENEIGLLFKLQNNSVFRNEPNFAPRVLTRQNGEEEIIWDKEIDFGNQKLYVQLTKPDGIFRIMVDKDGTLSLKAGVLHHSNEHGRVILKRKI